MLEFIAGVLMFVLVVLIWAGLGHGIWLLLAATGKAIFGDDSAPTATRCRQCGAPHGVVRGRCRYCLAVETVALPPPTLTAEIQGTLKQLDRLWRRGLISDDEHQRLRTACQRDLDRLQAGAPAAPATPVPAAPEAGMAYVEPQSPEAPPREEILDAEIVELADFVPAPAKAAPTHPLDRLEPAAPPVAPQPPRARRALADVLTGFMQERNIRWGELVSGLLIVGSAAGLVLSLRDQLSEWIPYFPAFLFLLATSAIHGAGLYTLRKWNLHSTSRGVLTITLLLVPLNFLAAILLSDDDTARFPVTSLTYLAAVTLGVLAYGAICYTGAQAMVGKIWPPLAAAVLGPSVVQLVINRAFGEAASDRHTLALGGLAVAPLVVGVLLTMLLGRRRRTLSPRRAQPLLLTLGLGSFAVALPLALLVARTPGYWPALAALSPALALVGVTVTAAGLFTTKRTLARQLAPLAVTGTALALLGGVVMLAAVGFAWPDPARLVMVGTLSAVALALLALVDRLPALHVPAVACATLATLVGFHWLQGNLSPDANDFGLQVLRTWLLGRSGLVLAGLAVVVTSLAGGLWWRQAKDHAQMLLASAAGLTVLSLTNALLAGFVHGLDRDLATITFVIYSLGLTVAAAIRPHPVLSVAAPLVWLVAGVHAVGYNGEIRAALAEREWLPDRPVLLATLVHACLVTLVAMVIAGRKRRADVQRDLVEPLALTAFAVSLTATWFAVFVRDQHFALHAGYVTAIALVWLATAALLYRAEILAAGQALASLALVYGVLALCQRQAWWVEGWRDPRTFALVIVSLALFGAAWAIARRVSLRWPRAHGLLAAPWPAVDQALLAMMVLLSAGGAGWATIPGIFDELQLVSLTLSPQDVSALQIYQHVTVWLALGALAVGLVAALWEKLDTAWLGLLTLLAVAPCSLLAIGFLDEVATASALRWLLAGYLSIVVGVLCARSRLARVLARVPGGWRGDFTASTAPTCISVALACGAAPIVLLTIIACACAANGIDPRGPLAETFFADLGWTVSYAAPLAVIVAGLLALGLRQREAGFVLGGSAVWQLVVSLGCIMPVLTSAGGTFDLPLAVKLWQWNAVGLGLYSLLWLALDRWLTRKGSARAPLLALQIVALLTTLAGLALWAIVWIVGALPGLGTWQTLAFGAWESFLALALAAVAAAWYGRSHARQAMPVLAAMLPILAVPFVAAALAPYDAVLAWTSYHALLTGWLAIAGCAAAVACARWEERVALRTACGLIGVVLGLNLFTGWNDPVESWTTAVNVAGLVVILCLGVFRQRNVFAYASVAVGLVTASQAFVHFRPVPAWELFDFLAVNLLAVTLLCGFWLAIEIDRERRKSLHVFDDRLPPVPLVLTPLLTAMIACLVGLCLALDIQRRPLGAWVEVLRPANIAALLTLGAYLVSLLWYDRQKMAIGCLYAWGLTASLVCSALVPPGLSLELVAVPTCAAIYLALTGWIWQAGARLADIGRRVGIHDPVRGLERTSRWLPYVTLALGGLLVMTDIGFVLLDDARLVRYAAAFGPLLVAISIVMQAQQQRRALMMYLSLLGATLAAVLISWAELPAGGEGVVWLRRLIRLLVVLGSLAFLYATVLPRVWSHLSDWMKALRHMALTCGGGAAVSLVAILALETLEFAAGRPAPLSHAEVGIVAVVLTLLSATLIALAVSPQFAATRGFDAREASRRGYVYAAQVVLALAFGHLYLTRPYWFDGLLRPYWPYIVMAIAFAGVGISEWFQRRNVRVLAEPLTRTGAFLPLLPAIGWWVEAARGTPTTDYALVMFVVGLLYVVVSVTRQSTLSAVAAALAGNVALWALMSDRGWSFAAHPQFWLIPPALSVLAAVQLNHRRLREEQLTAARYGCMLVIYLSSTSEIFITGITSIWPPLALATLAVIGVLAGIALQVRAFLYLGTSFVFLAMVTMVWHASSAFGVWPWWVFGICVGLAMLVFFGLFEKKRTEITALVDRLRQWEH